MTLKDELLHLIREDQAVREVLASTGELFHGYHPAMEKVHLKNARQLKELIEKNKGFPTESQVGKEACVAALRVVLHAISWPEFMRSLEEPLLSLAKANKVPKSYVAMLVDRIRFYEGLKQVYATQADWDENGILRISEVEDFDSLNSRRAAMDLPPLKSLVITPEDGEYHPPDPGRRYKEFLEWTRKVGWRS